MEAKGQLYVACGHKLGHYHDRYAMEVGHLKVLSWTASLVFFREKRHCKNCNKVRSELIEWLCPTSPHMTMELAWWINRMSEITSVLLKEYNERWTHQGKNYNGKTPMETFLDGLKIAREKAIHQNLN